LDFSHVDKVWGRVGNGCTDPLDACLDTSERELPEPWKIPAEDAIALQQYLIYRLDHIEDMCSLITGR